MIFKLGRISNGYDTEKTVEINTIEELLKLSREEKCDLIVGYGYDLDGNTQETTPQIYVFDDYLD